LTIVKQPPVGQGLLIIETSRSHSRHTTFGKTPLGEWSARRRELYLKKLNTHKRHTSKLHGGIRNLNLSKRTDADPRLRTRGHWDRLVKA